MLRVAAFTGGKNVSPARFRVRQYITYLKNKGIELKEFYAPLGAWPPSSCWLRPIWGAGTVISRIPAVVASHRSDVTLLQQSMVSTYYTLEGLTGRPRVLDLDDAIWAFGRRETFFPRLIECCDSVICGNSFLADHVSRWNRNVTIIPTGVDTEYFRPVANGSLDHCIVIGWSGGSGGFRYLYMIEDALRVVLENNPGVLLSIIADRAPCFQNLPSDQVIFTPWSAENEVETIQAMDIGIMPMDDSVVSRGKCSYKMLLYMACAKPVVASPYGMNREVFSRERIGLEAESIADWVDSLSLLLQDRELRRVLGKAGRRVVCSHYSTAVTGMQLAEYLHRYSEND